MLLAAINIKSIYVEDTDLTEEELAKFNSINDEEKIIFLRELVNDFILDTEITLNKE